MMIAARLAGGNHFLLFWVVGDFGVHSEHSDFFLRGFFFWGWWGAFWIVSVGQN